MLELAILGLLKERSMHGYQLSKRLTDTLGFWRVSYGSLYPTLRRLDQQGAVEKVFDQVEVGRRKNVYRITEKGEKLFFELLQDANTETGEDRFRVRLAFFKYLAPEARIRLLERRRTFLEERLGTIEASLSGDRDGTDTYTRALMEHGAESTEQDIAWLDDLIQAERNIAGRATTKAKGKPAKGGTKRRSKRSTTRTKGLRGKERTT
ncbi:MAG: PadR family transcriptional regulator [Actinomycetota bacterium]